MFNSIYSSSVTPARFFLMAAVTLLAGLLYALVMSLCVRSSKRFFLVVSIIPLIVASVICFVNGSIGAGVAVGGAFGLIRFRSAPGSADEIAAILAAMGAGIAFVLLSRLNLFERRGESEDKLLRVTIPEALEYTGAFDGVFERYLTKAESVGVKTTGMGSLFRLSYRIRMKDGAEEKAFIDALRTRNGNLEIAVLPWTEQQPGQL